MKHSSRIRRLKIESDGAHFNPARRAPKVRLRGHWLRRAGFESGAHVELTILSAGVIVLRALTEPANPTSAFSP